MSYSSGKHAWGICDRSGFRYKLNDLVYEYQNGVKTGLRVGKDMLDPDHPQNYVGRILTGDPRPLKDPRPDVDPGDTLFGWNPVWNSAQYMVASTGNVQIAVSYYIMDENDEILLDENDLPISSAD